MDKKKWVRGCFVDSPKKGPDPNPGANIVIGTISVLVSLITLYIALKY